MRLAALLLVGVGLIAFALLGGRLPFDIFAGAPVTPAPRPTAPPASPTPSPTPEAWRADPSHPANEFSALMTSPDVSYHLETKVTASYLTSQDVLAEAWDVSGADLTYLLTYNKPSGIAKRKAIRVGDRLYVKEDAKDWVEQQVFDRWDIFGAKTNDAYARLMFVGQEVRDGKAVYHVVLPVAGFPYVSTDALVITGAPSVSSWDVWVDETGHPLTASMRAGFNGVIERRSIPIQMLFEYTFSKVGDPVDIQAPASFR